MPVRVLLRPAAAVVVVALATSGCTSTRSSTESTATTTVTEAPTGGAVTPDAAAASVAPRTSGTGSTSGDTKGSRPTDSTGGDAGRSGTTSGGPAIVYFRIAGKPSCPAGTTVNPIAGQPVLVEWKATDVDSVALSVDGPGIYGDNYPATGSETFPFPCSGKEGDIQKHTYLLTVRNARGTRTKTLVVSARVHDVPAV
ncbi:hypothetical protein ACH495_10145 [Micromonospora sp. NPDC018662]|uniref:hypothetical protein n=1 Tax=Micromonospora sp. NPDC018662 TaxID=3364238 RepID=UPI00379E3ECB